LVVPAPGTGQVVPVGGDPAPVDQHRRPIVQEKGREQVVAILVLKIPVPQNDLVLEVIRAAEGDSAVFHRGQVFRGFPGQAQRFGSPHRFDMLIKGTTLLQPVQLPDAEPDTQSATGQSEQGRQEPLARKHGAQDHAAFSFFLSDPSKILYTANKAPSGKPANRIPVSRVPSVTGWSTSMPNTLVGWKEHSRM
jgi:hypothetical protein